MFFPICVVQNRIMLLYNDMIFEETVLRRVYCSAKYAVISVYLQQALLKTSYPFTKGWGRVARRGVGGVEDLKRSHSFLPIQFCQLELHRTVRIQNYDLRVRIHFDTFAPFVHHLVIYLILLGLGKHRPQPLFISHDCLIFRTQVNSTAV